MGKKEKAEKIREILNLREVWNCSYEKLTFGMETMLDKFIVDNLEIDFIIHQLNNEKYKFNDMIDKKIDELKKLK
jgi:hypothetical protein